MDRSAKPARMMLLERRRPDRRPARIATANIVRDSGASDRPVWSALYSRTIWRKIGSAIIAPPSAMFWSVWPLMPSRKIADLSRFGSISVTLPWAFRRREPPPQQPERHDAGHDQDPDGLRALLPGEDAEHDATHAQHGQERADGIETSIAGVRDVLHEPDAGKDDPDDDELEEEADPPRQERRDEAAEQRSDRRRDRRRGTHERIHPLLGSAFEVAVDERLHGRQQERGAQPAHDRPEDDRPAPGSARASSPVHRPRIPAGR